VEIETHARCNRVCSFCPNAIVDRRCNRTRTGADVLDRVFAQLGAIDYRGKIKVARYSEPLADVEALCERLTVARRLVPHAQLAIVTNTDYLTPEILDRLVGIGLNVVYMSLYLRDREQWSPGLAREYTRRLAERMGLRITAARESATGLRCTLGHPTIELSTACMNFDTYGTDRGGAMAQYAALDRAGPCREPFQTFVIDYTGQVVACCNVRSDLPEHAGLAVADLSDPDTSIFDVYATRLAGWRQHGRCGTEGRAV
jgi:hypothetical protein